MEATCTTTNTPVISGLISFVFYQRISTKASSFHKTFWKFWSSLQQQRHVEIEHSVAQKQSIHPHDEDSVSLQREEVEMLIGKLGLSSGGGGGGGEGKVYGREELMKVFEESKPSMEEVEEAFSVFDGNRDGFIDAEDLQRVLCVLGFREGGEVADCEKMIGVFDEDGDGKIGFQEFVKLMESSCW